MKTESREYQAAKTLEDALNDMSWNPKEFAEACLTLHPTLQQTLYRTIVEVVKVYADPNRYTDGRNRASKEEAQKLMKVLNESYLPFI